MTLHNISHIMNEKKLKENGISFDEILNQLPKSRKAVILENSRYRVAMLEVKKLREQLNLTQQDLADRSGLPRITIARIESGKQNISIEKLMKIASGVGKELEIKFV